MAEKNPYTKVIARAWKDAAFKKKLLADPKAALKEMGIETPHDSSVKFVEDTPKNMTLVLPAAPVQVKELNDTELEKIAAASYTEDLKFRHSTKP